MVGEVELDLKGVAFFFFFWGLIVSRMVIIEGFRWVFQRSEVEVTSKTRENLLCFCC